MATTLTAAALHDIVAARDAIAAAYACGDIDAAAAIGQLDSWLNETLAPWAGTGTADADFAASLGPDYICALDDGRILAWGGDAVTVPGAADRKLLIYSEPGVSTEA